ncbi:hypothetical protein DCAR_0728047 [Daucus carota subsp. sativus]|uniref:Uncharacterized protein n=1 Tax=Daucus carota subsp. sativus TaxID=79200 RepID=A0A164T6S4_DAUCS|nr:hypothetical protein DCAR_0728047 [Daucus carota subsp. sativus]
MKSQIEVRINQITEENKLMEETIKILEEENAKLQHRIKLMEIQQNHDESVIDVLKKHNEERRAFNHFIMDDSNFEPSKTAERERIREDFAAEAERRKAAKTSQAERKEEKK